MQYPKHMWFSSTVGFHWVSWVMHVTNLSVSDRLLSHELLVSGEYNALLMYSIGMAV